MTEMRQLLENNLKQRCQEAYQWSPPLTRAVTLPEKSPYHGEENRQYGNEIKMALSLNPKNLREHKRLTQC